MVIKFKLFLFVILLTTNAYSQISTPERRPFNLGMSAGFGGVSYTLFPSVDFLYKGTSLRISPGYSAITGGISQELLGLSEVYYQWRWVASAYYSFSRPDGMWPKGYGVDGMGENVNRMMFLTGVKSVFGSRFYTYFQVGVMHSRYLRYETMIGGIIPGVVEPYNDTELYFEFSLGINMFRNYKPFGEQ